MIVRQIVNAIPVFEKKSLNLILDKQEIKRNVVFDKKSKTDRIFFFSISKIQIFPKLIILRFNIFLLSRQLQWKSIICKGNTRWQHLSQKKLDRFILTPNEANLAKRTSLHRRYSKEDC